MSLAGRTQRDALDASGAQLREARDERDAARGAIDARYAAGVAAGRAEASAGFAGVSAAVEEAVDETGLNKIATKMQNSCRGFLARKKVARRREAKVVEDKDKAEAAKLAKAQVRYLPGHRRCMTGLH